MTGRSGPMSAISSGVACRSTACGAAGGGATATGRWNGTGVGIRRGAGVRCASGSWPDCASNTAWQRPHSTRKARWTGPASPSWTEKIAWHRAQRISTSRAYPTTSALGKASAANSGGDTMQWCPLTAQLGTPPRLGLRLVQPERGVERAHRQLGVLLVDEAAHLDLAGGDDADVHSLVGQHLEHLGGHPGVVAHAHADDAHLRDPL